MADQAYQPVMRSGGQVRTDYMPPQSNLEREYQSVIRSERATRVTPVVALDASQNYQSVIRSHPEPIVLSQFECYTSEADGSYSKENMAVALQTDRRQDKVRTFQLQAIQQLSFWSLFCKPWASVWKWVLLVGCIASLLSGIGSSAGVLPHELYTFVMAATIPLTMVVLFCEWDVTRAVSGWIAGLVVFLGGSLTGLLAEVVNTYFDISLESAGFAGLTEEPIKGIALLILAMFPRQFPGILSGLALGVSIGAGFAVLETFEYAYAFSETGQPDTYVLLLRGILSPLMHMAWTGALGGAMWAARGPNRSGWTALTSWQFWGIFVLMIVFHCIWNVIGVVNYLAIALWSLIFYYLKRGLAEATSCDFKTKDV